MPQLLPITRSQRITRAGFPASRAPAGGPVSAHRPAFFPAAQPSTEKELTARFERDAIPLLPQLYRGALGLTGSRADSQDLLQDTMLKAYANFSSFQPGTDLKAWLFRILRNTWINAYRTTRRRPLECLSSEIADWQLIAHDRHAAATLRSAELEALETLADEEVSGALSALPKNLQMVIYYADVEGFRYREIAEIMKTPVGTVMSRLHRARRLLRVLLADVARERGFPPSELLQAG
jgi:RNA polymerase sigma-70 factor, ECF subfamily